VIESLPLEFRHKMIIVNALLECDCLKPDLQAVSGQLDRQIQSRLKPGRARNQALLELVDVCLNFPGGIAQLMHVVGFLEEKSSRNFRRLHAAVLEARVLYQTKMDLEALRALQEQDHLLEALRPRLDSIIAACLRGRPTINLPETLTPYTAFLELFLPGAESALAFLQRLTCDEACAAGPARAIRAWMDANAVQLCGSRERLASIRSEVEAAASRPVCILLKLEENQMENDHYRMQAWGWRDEDEGPIPIELEPALEEESRFGKGHPMARLDHAVREVVRAAKHQYDTADVVVELFVERKLFSQAIGGWEIYLGESSRVRLVNKHPVFLRWLNRYGARRRDHREWEKKWKQVKTALRPSLEWLPAPDSHTPDAIANGWAAPDRGLCVGLGYVPPPRREGDCLDAVRDCGTPILCWVNPLQKDDAWSRETFESSRETFESMLAGATLTDLPAHFLKQRQALFASDNAHPVHRLVLLFDDADRTLPAPVGSQRT
jgi:vWA-MoxR associated protein C-terminal domain/Effector-associated domain 2